MTYIALNTPTKIFSNFVNSIDKRNNLLYTFCRTRTANVPVEINPAKATHQRTRTHNERLVFRTIFERDRISRADVARVTGLTRTTVSQVVDTLIRTKMVKEVGTGKSTGGKSPILLSVPGNARQLIGVDLGSTEFRGAIVNLRGEIQYALTMPLEGRQGTEALERAFQLIDALKRHATSPLLGIGVGAPGVIDPTKGSSVHWAVNLSWLDLPIRALLKKRYRVPVYVANDSHTAVLAESFFGQWRNVNLLVVKVESGVSAGIFANGELWKGDGFGAGEIGHVTVAEAGPPCHCGHVGCLEAVVRIDAIVQRARTAARDSSGLLNQRAPKLQMLTFEDVVWAFEQDDPTAANVVRDTAHYLGRALANLVAALNITHIVIAGPVIKFGPSFLCDIRETMLSHSLAHLAEGTLLEFSTLGQDIVILGASALLLNDVLGMSPAG